MSKSYQSKKKNFFPLEIMNLYNENYDFIFKSIDIILKKKVTGKKIDKYGKLNIVPSYKFILANIHKLILKN